MRATLVLSVGSSGAGAGRGSSRWCIAAEEATRRSLLYERIAGCRAHMRDFSLGVKNSQLKWSMRKGDTRSWEVERAGETGPNPLYRALSMAAFGHGKVRGRGRQDSSRGRKRRDVDVE